MGNCCKPAQVGHTKSSNIASTPGTSKYNSRYSLSGDQLNPNGLILPTRDMRVFTFAELSNATNNFNSVLVLGEGRFGKIYKGWIDEKSAAPGGYAVAVKKSISESMQVFEAWQCEVNFLGRLQHPNLLRLLGYCWEDEKLLLVYEFMQNQSLDKHLFGKGSAIELLSWNLRLKILLGAARGLAFLHSSVTHIIYRDFMASKILLDADYNAKLSHFGLARNAPTGSALHVITGVIGRYGNPAPEYIATGYLSEKSDVYSFGVVLLEMLTGRRAWDVNRRPIEQRNLVDWSKPYLSDGRKLRRIMDPRLENQFPPKAATQAAQLTLSCLGSEPRVRPSMKEVVDSLEQIQEIKS